MISARVAMLTRFLTEDLCLTSEELLALRNTLGEWAANHAPGSMTLEPRRTLYLPQDPLDDL